MRCKGVGRGGFFGSADPLARQFSYFYHANAQNLGSDPPGNPKITPGKHHGDAFGEVECGAEMRGEVE